MGLTMKTHGVDRPGTTIVPRVLRTLRSTAVGIRMARATGRGWNRRRRHTDVRMKGAMHGIPRLLRMADGQACPRRYHRAEARDRPHGKLKALRPMRGAGGVSGGCDRFTGCLFFRSLVLSSRKRTSAPASRAVVP